MRLKKNIIEWQSVLESEAWELEEAKEDFQQWRLWCLTLGFFLWLLAPIVSKWIPFYYSSSMAIGIFLVIIILLFQSTLDTLMAIAALASCGAICSLVPSRKQLRHLDQSSHGIVKHGHAEFLSRSPRTYPKEKLWNSPMSLPAWSNSPVKGVSSTSSGTRNQEYYSTFHKTGNRKKFTKQEWEDFTRESTRKAMADLAATPEFTDWLIAHADRIKLISNDSSDESIGSKSSSIDEEAEESSSQFRFFGWKR